MGLGRPSYIVRITGTFLSSTSHVCRNNITHGAKVRYNSRATRYTHTDRADQTSMEDGARRHGGQDPGIRGDAKDGAGCHDGVWGFNFGRRDGGYVFVEVLIFAVL